MLYQFNCHSNLILNLNVILNLQFVVKATEQYFHVCFVIDYAQSGSKNGV